MNNNKLSACGVLKIYEHVFIEEIYNDY